jgi:hypothetical protein
METDPNPEYVIDATIRRVHLVVRVRASRSGLRAFARGARATNNQLDATVDKFPHIASVAG